MSLVLFVLIIYFHMLSTTEIYIRIIQAPWTSSVLEVTGGICRPVGPNGVVGLGGERERWDRRRKDRSRMFLSMFVWSIMSGKVVVVDGDLYGRYRSGLWLWS